MPCCHDNHNTVIELAMQRRAAFSWAGQKAMRSLRSSSLRSRDALHLSSTIVKRLETGLINTFPADSPRCAVDNIVDSFHEPIHLVSVNAAGQAFFAHNNNGQHQGNISYQSCSNVSSWHVGNKVIQLQDTQVQFEKPWKHFRHVTDLPLKWE